MKRNTKLRLLGCTLMVAGSAILLSLLTGCGGGDSYAQEIEKPPASLMEPTAWEIGPIIWELDRHKPGSRISFNPQAQRDRLRWQ